METAIILGKFFLASAVLLAFYAIALRRHGSYRIRRQYLLLTPVFALLISTFSFRLSFLETIDIELPPVPEPVPTMHNVPYENAVVWTTADVPASTPSTLSDGTEPMVDTQEALSAHNYAIEANMQTPRNYEGWMLLIAGLISALLLCLWCSSMIRMWKMQRRMPTQTTAEGYRLIRSPRVSTPFSFGRTIFLPESMEAECEAMVICHEKAHIAHRHYLELWLIEVLTRLCWYNPVLWLCRTELRNVHEYEADHDVIHRGIDTYTYQNTLLQMTLNENCPVVCGFNPSFIRRRFIEMKANSAGTLTQRDKWLAVTGLFLLLSAIGYCSCQLNIQQSLLPKGLEPCPFASMDTLPRLEKPQPFTLNLHFSPTDGIKKVYIYHSDDYFRFNGDHPVETLQVNNGKCKYKVMLDHMIGGAWRTDKDSTQIHQLFFVPGEGVFFNNVQYKYSSNYEENVRLSAQLVRRLTRYQSPHIPKAHGKRWHQPGCTSNSIFFNHSRHWTEGSYMIRDVFYSDTATIVHIVSKNAMKPFLFTDGGSLKLIEGSKKKQHKLIRTLNDPHNLDAMIFGIYAVFKPIPMDFKPFEVKGKDYVIAKPNKMKVKVLDDNAPEPDDFQDRWFDYTKELPYYYYKTASTDNVKVAARNYLPQLEFVQLWEGGPKFATTNIGANRPWQYGNLMNWEKALRSSEQMYEGCRLPTQKDVNELRKHCNTYWVDRKGNQHAGIMVSGRGEYKGNTIFFPAGGDSEGTEANPGRIGFFWTSDDAPKQKYRDNEAFAIGAYNSGFIGCVSLEKELGLSVRLVKD